jgi:hypothetical protein
LYPGQAYTMVWGFEEDPQVLRVGNLG